LLFKFGMRGSAVLSCTAIAFAMAAIAQNSRPTPPHAAPSPTFAHDIAQILYKNCASCHRPGESGPFSLLSYEDAKKHASQIATATGIRAMPPWLPEPGYGDFENNPRLSAEEIRLIGEWVKNGAPQGPAAEVPTPPNFTEGWQLGPPDMILDASRAFTLPAHGPDVFYNFIFSPQITATRFVRAIEIRPGDTNAIHHANVIVDRARSARRQETEPGAGFPGMDVKIARSAFDFDTHFLFWKPGTAPWSEPDGFAWRLDPGNDLVLNAHMMTMGMPEEVKPSIGLYFTDSPPAHFPLLIRLEHDGALDIPAGVPDFVVTDHFRLPLDVDVLAVYPHAHYLGHIVEGYATLPNGERKQLIRIAHWNPKWQAVYHYREPVFLPKGTVVSMRWHYDNSAANPRNPHRPPQRVRSGNQSTDEMSHLYLQVLPRGNGDHRREIEEALMLHQLEKYPDDFQAHLWLGALMLSRMNPSGAVSVLEDAVQLDPKQPEGHYWLGAALGAVGRLNEAMEQYRIALAIQPDYTSALYNLAKALTKSGHLDEAFQDFSKVVAAFPQDAQVRNDFGDLLLQMGKPAEALEQFEKALAIDPSNQTARKNRDLALQQLPAH
jgi:Flp pilus assembly protein TadD/mono/diheme cytochrome c family protein